MSIRARVRRAVYSRPQWTSPPISGESALDRGARADARRACRARLRAPLHGAVREPRHRRRPARCRSSSSAIFDKIVVRRRGGFCYELNGLFAGLLRELGFEVTLLAGQTRRPGHGRARPRARPPRPPRRPRRGRGSSTSAGARPTAAPSHSAPAPSTSTRGSPRTGSSERDGRWQVVERHDGQPASPT